MLRLEDSLYDTRPLLLYRIMLYRRLYCRTLCSLLLTAPSDIVFLFFEMLYSVNCVLYSVDCVLYSVDCVLYSVDCVLYSVD